MVLVLCGFQRATGLAFLTLFALFSSAACGPASATMTTAPTMDARATASVAHEVDPKAEHPIDLAITFDPRVTGEAGWAKLGAELPLELLGYPGANIVDLTASRVPFAAGDPLRNQWLTAILAKANLADTSLIVDEAALCLPEIHAAFAHAHPARALVSIQGGITPKALACLRALDAPRFYVAGCLYRAHRDPGENTCDGDAELDALIGDESVRARVRGVALSLSTRGAAQKLGRFPALEYLAFSPGRGADFPIFDELPFGELDHVRYLEASGENRPASMLMPAALHFLAHLHTLRWNGDEWSAGTPWPAPCRLERASYGVLSAKDVDALGACSHLRELSSDQVQLEDAKPVARFVSLERLHLRHLKATDLTPLTRLINLRHLSLDASNAADFGFVSRLTNLVSLDLSQTSFHDLTLVSGLASLEDLDVAFDPVLDLSPLAANTKLRRLAVAETKVVDLTVIAKLTALSELSFGDTRVNDLSPLAGLPLLERVFLHGTAVTDASALLTLPNLKRANIHGLTLPKAEVDALRQRLHGDLYD